MAPRMPPTRPRPESRACHRRHSPGISTNSGWGLCRSGCCRSRRHIIGSQRAFIRPEIELTPTTHRMSEGVLSQSSSPGDGETIDSFELDLSPLPAFSPPDKLMLEPSNKKHQEFICHISPEAVINPPETSRRPAHANDGSHYF